MAEVTILVANTSAVFDHDGQRIVIRKGVTRVRDGHPLLKGREDLFDPITVHYDVEDARAKPGESRHEPSGGPPSETASAAREETSKAGQAPAKPAKDGRGRKPKTGQ